MLNSIFYILIYLSNYNNNTILITSANRSPCGSNCKAIPCRISSINSSNRKNLMAHSDRQSLQYIPISNSRDLSKSIENLIINLIVIITVKIICFLIYNLLKIIHKCMHTQFKIVFYILEIFCTK